MDVAVFVAAQQVRAESRDAMFDELPSAIAAQLSAWGETWTETSRVAERGRDLVGFIGADVDESLSRVWIHGPLVAGPDWNTDADALLEALASGVPAVSRKEAEIAADVANGRVAAFAARHGFAAGKEHHLLVLASPRIRQLARAALGPLPAEHEEAFIALHEELFPETYYSGRQLLEQRAQGEAIVLGTVDGRELVGYAAGRIDEAGDGYLDFVGVAPSERRRGVGTALVAAIGHAFCERSPIGAMRLTVSSENTAALALYSTLGFELQSSAVGYRRPPEPRA